MRQGTIILKHYNYILCCIISYTAKYRIQKDKPSISLANSYSVSKPLIKIYFPVMKLSSASFTALFSQKILLITKKKGYMDFHNWWDDSVSYSPVSKDNQSAGFVFTYNLPFTSVNEQGYTAFCYNFPQVTNLLLNKTSLNQLSKKIERMCHILIRSRTTHWLNEHERR